MQAVTDKTGCTPPGPQDPETRPEAQATGDAGVLPTPPAAPPPDDPTENTRARPQETAERDGREGPDSRRAEQLAAVSAEEMDKFDRDRIHYDTDEELDSRRFMMGPTGTGGHDTGERRPRDPQQPTQDARRGTRRTRKPATIHSHG